LIPTERASTPNPLLAFLLCISADPQALSTARRSGQSPRHSSVRSTTACAAPTSTCRIARVVSTDVRFPAPIFKSTTRAWSTCANGSLPN
jgi:hypothetical protein